MQYEVGKGEAPAWCRRLITPYRTNDGTTKYELQGKYLTFILSKGDILYQDDAGTIRIVQKGKA